MKKYITIHNSDNLTVAEIKVDFDKGTVTLKNDKGNSLITLGADSTVVEHAGYHVHIGVDFGTCPERSE